MVMQTLGYVKSIHCLQCKNIGNTIKIKTFTIMVQCDTPLPCYINYSDGSCGGLGSVVVVY